MKSQLSIRIFFLRCRTDGWYVVTKGKIRLRVFLFCSRADCIVAKLTSHSVARISFFFGYPHLVRGDLRPREWKRYIDDSSLHGTPPDRTLTCSLNKSTIFILQSILRLKIQRSKPYS